MNAIAADSRLSFDEFLESPERFRCELEDGHLVEKLVSILSSIVANKLSTHLTNYCIAKDLGEVMNSEAIYRCFADQPNSGRRPDVSFVAKERLPSDWFDLGYSSIAPDLAVEVVSPNDLAYEVDRKTQQYLDAGVRLVWLVNPEERIIHVHRADDSVVKLREADQLLGENVVPGFACRVADLFPARGR